MPHFSHTSLKRLATCEPQLQAVMREVIKHMDCTIVEGHRSEADQHAYYRAGKSRVRWPHGKHNRRPSEAVDVAPYISGKGLSWNAYHCIHLAGFVLGTAAAMGIDIRWGGDWDMDGEAVTDQSFNDLVHFELA